MFQTAELGQTLSKNAFKRSELQLRERLLALQQDLRRAGESALLIDFAGVRGAGKGTSTNLLNKWMDNRWIETHAYSEPSDEERERPRRWRFWRDLPARGTIGIFLSGRYSRPLLEYVYGESTLEAFNHQLAQIKAFEKMLADDGALITKFWMHISRDVQRERLEKLAEDPLQNWRISPEDWTHLELYDRFVDAAEHLIAYTNTGQAPWEIVEGTDYHFRSIRVGNVLAESLERHLSQHQIRRKYAAEIEQERRDLAVPAARDKDGSPATIMQGLNLSLTLDKHRYQGQLETLQARLSTLHQQAVRQRLTTILVFEGPDAAGKSGAIRHLTDPLEAHTYKVYPFSAPTDEELAHHYLWRFWRRLPRAGRVTIFDRSWYGRVLVERIEGFANDLEWRRAWSEINNFEQQLVEHGIVLLKFWIHISEDEQLRRFRARESTPHKQWKLTDEDWRNREKWDQYELAAHHMIQNTARQDTPWILVEGNDKPYARIKVLRAVCDALEEKTGR
ncbi:MAG: polyphosphate:AMP phosphotransferase [Xanthomonadales bacterium]|nr:polyphosphate:AMP phosphotransferase [Xanthomonadales bacterium]NIN58628.1 polyphosphate:AMP phosphotransferase [Xanthomonadales bacterium]NIN73917.1 polyphosphate:AMP phosphotransferase [Xanthomonadales bacterium]NIO12386.1 polyphosphate:AMP phosphotransferase [Xanthomonadales bacterium]NIP11021.1 polyphosphate:AMP phosphotransferase [Xanthomonadales bacterium]